MEQKDFVLEFLNDRGLAIFQPKQGYRFSLDAILLARFATVKKGYKVLDLGTGSGVIPLLLSTREKNLFIQGVEIQPRLAKLAEANVELNCKQAEIAILEQDLNHLPKEWNGKWDLVVSNPPYFKAKAGKISLGEKAIARHELKCSLEDVVQVSARLLKGRGQFALIHRAERLPEALILLTRSGLAPSRLKLVHPQRGKKAMLFLLEGVKGAALTLTILPPLIVYDSPGKYSEEMERIYSGLSM